MASKADKQPETCSTCGAEPDYNYIRNNGKCNYCGTEFKINTSDLVSDADNAGYYPFIMNKDAVTKKIADHLINDNQTPVDIFSLGDVSIHKLYLPVYNFEGTYNGTYAIVKSNGDIKTDNIALAGNFSVYVYGGLRSSEIYKNIAASYLHNPDGSKILSPDEINFKDVSLRAFGSEGDVWQSEGELKAAEHVYDILKKQNASGPVKYNHYLDYKITATGKVYVPAWEICISYHGRQYLVYLNDTDGSITGQLPQDILLTPPPREKVFKRYLLIGLGLWAGWLIVRAALSAFLGGHFNHEDPYYDNLFISRPVGFYWFMRGVIFTLLFPACMSTLFYGLIAKSYCGNLKRVRSLHFGNMITGRTKDIFSANTARC